MVSLIGKSAIDWPSFLLPHLHVQWKHVAAGTYLRSKSLRNKSRPLKVKKKKKKKKIAKSIGVEGPMANIWRRFNKQPNECLREMFESFIGLGRWFTRAEEEVVQLGTSCQTGSSHPPKIVERFRTYSSEPVGYDFDVFTMGFLGAMEPPFFGCQRRLTFCMRSNRLFSVMLRAGWLSQWIHEFFMNSCPFDDVISTFSICFNLELFTNSLDLNQLFKAPVLE